MFSKFIPYVPVISLKGRKIVDRTVRMRSCSLVRTCWLIWTSWWAVFSFDSWGSMLREACSMSVMQEMSDDRRDFTMV